MKKPSTWLQRLVAFPAAYRSNVAESLKLAAAVGQPPPMGTIRYWAIRFALLTLRRRRVVNDPVEDRKARDVARFKAIAAEVERAGTNGVVLVPNGDSFEYVRHHLFTYINVPMRVWSNVGRRAEYANGSTLLFRNDQQFECTRGYHLDWAWIVDPRPRTEQWPDRLEPALRYSRGKLYVGTEPAISYAAEHIA